MMANLSFCKFSFSVFKGLIFASRAFICKFKLEAVALRALAAPATNSATGKITKIIVRTQMPAKMYSRIEINLRKRWLFFKALRLNSKGLS